MQSEREVRDLSFPLSRFSPTEVQRHSATPGMENTMSHVCAVWGHQRNNSPIYALLLDGIDIHYAEHGVVRATLPVQSLHVNSKNSVHGTLSACVVDWAAGMGIASTGLDVTGISTDLSVWYVSKAQLGDILEIEGKILKIGKTLAFTMITIGKRMDGRTVDIVHGSHTKFLR